MSYSQISSARLTAGTFGKSPTIWSAVAALAVLAFGVTPTSAALINRWAFEEPNGTLAPQVLDSIGGNHGTFVAMDDTNRVNDSPPAHLPGRSLLFDGVNETVTLASQIGLPQSSNYSVAFWYRGTETGETGDDWGRTLIGRDNNDIFSNIIVRGGKIEYVHFSGGWQHNIASTTLVNDNEWHHIAFVNHSTATADLYIDGIQEIFGQSSASGGIAFRIDGFMKGFGLTPPNRFSDGTLDDVRIYDHALTAAEVLDLNPSVPEPSSALLLLGGLLLGRRHLKRLHRSERQG